MPGHVYKFDDIVVDPGSFQVCQGGRALDLEPKSLRVLVFLVENAGRAVTKEELLSVVWQGAFVTDNALTRVIAQLRKALGDNAKEARYIETVPTLGYRFLARVEVAETAGPSRIADSAPLALKTVRNAPLAPFALVMLAILLAASGVFAWRRFSAPVVAARSNERPPHLVQFTASTGLDLNPAFSPDGSAIAYSSDRSGGFEIYIRPSATQGREIQVTSDAAQNVEPAWSPDGRYIAYRSAAKGGIWLVPALGGVARQLTMFGASPAWSRDGTAIAFQSAAPVSLAPIDIAGIDTTIWVVPAQGGPPKQITTPASPPGKHVWPAWSPDGRWILFVNFAIDATTPNGLWAVSPADGEVVSVAAGDRIYLNPIYAPDQRSIYYASFTDTGNFGLWRLPVDPATDKAAGPAVDVQRTGMDLPRDFAISADGKRLAFTLSTMSSQLWTLPMSRSSFEPAGDPALLTPDTSLRKMHPAFSPDGKRLAFYSQLRGAPSEIWVMNAEGSDAAAITRRASGSYMPSWLPDGKSVVYASNRTNSTSNVWLTSLDDGAERPFLNLPRFMTAPHLSPGGGEVVYHASKDGVANIWKGSVATGEQTQLTFDKESMNFPCWSPDGKWIAFEVRRGESTQLGVMPKDGGAHTLLTEGRGHSWPFSWSPDGGKILFAGVRDGVWNVWWISRATRQQQRLTDYRSLRSYVRYPAWSPSGDQIVYERGETKGNIYLLDAR